MTENTRESLKEILHALLGTAVVVALLSVLIGCATLPTDDQGTSLSSTEKVAFETEIKPLFESRCVMCHNGHTSAGDLNLLTRDLAFRQSSNGPFIVPGDPERSKLLRMVRLADAEAGAMPPTGHSLDEHELALVKKWIEQGADWPAGEPGYLQPTTGMHWRSR